MHHVGHIEIKISYLVNALSSSFMSLQSQCIAAIAINNFKWRYEWLESVVTSQRPIWSLGKFSWLFIHQIRSEMLQNALKKFTCPSFLLIQNYINFSNL